MNAIPALRISIGRCCVPARRSWGSTARRGRLQQRATGATSTFACAELSQDQTLPGRSLPCEADEIHRVGEQVEARESFEEALRDAATCVDVTCFL